MIIERLAKLDQPKRILAAVLTVLAVACICYYVITRDFVVRLWTTKAKYAGVQAAYAGTENQRAFFLNLQRQFEDRKKQIKDQERKCFSSEQALQFFENINTIALAYNLKPISRIISEPKRLSADKEAESQQLLETQSAKITVAGNYSDIVNFVDELTDRPQKICITNLHIALPPGEKLIQGHHSRFLCLYKFLTHLRVKQAYLREMSWPMQPLLQVLTLTRKLRCCVRQRFATLWNSARQRLLRAKPEN